MNDDIADKTILVYLTGRRPLRVKTGEWPVLTEASWVTHDGQVEVEANRRWDLMLKVRQAADGRTLVYAIYDYDTNFQGEASFLARVGQMYDSQSSGIEQLIGYVGEELRQRIESGTEPHDDGEIRRVLSHIDGVVSEAINALPPEDI